MSIRKLLTSKKNNEYIYYVTGMIMSYYLVFGIKQVKSLFFFVRLVKISKFVKLLPVTTFRLIFLDYYKDTKLIVTVYQLVRYLF